MPLNWKTRTVIFGGTFDPPHLSHRVAVQGVFRLPGVERVLVIPAAAPPHKPTQATADQRLAMARLNFDGISDVEILDLELNRAKKNPTAPSYSWDTIQELKPNYPRLGFVLGSDQLEQFSTWHRFPELLGACDWLVLARKPLGWAQAEKTLALWSASGLVRTEGTGDQQSLWKTRLGTHLGLVSTDAPALSSTQIREQIVRTGEPPESLLIPKVSAYLKAHRIYGTKGGLL